MSFTDNPLEERLTEHLEGKYINISANLGELSIEVSVENYLDLCRILSNGPAFGFEQLTDLCAVDYSEHPDFPAKKFAVVLHLLSLKYNERIRIRVFLSDDEMPVIDSVTGIWPAANWFEREAFDMFGVIFKGHNDLRRILTDYGFIGHPFRKDFPVEGHVEMRYDPEKERVVYEPVTIEERVLIPKTYGT